MQAPSPRGKLNLSDAKSLGITASFFALASLLTYLTGHLTQLHLSDAEYLIISGILGMLLKVVQKLQDGN